MNIETDFSVPEQDRRMYAELMERIKLRIDEAADLLQKGADERAVFYAAAQLRLTVEEVAFASLVGNRQALEEAQRSVGFKKWDDVRKSLTALNPDYWPHGVVAVHSEGGHIEWQDAEGVLSEQESSKVWGKLSRLLHARNPWAPPLDWKEEKAYLILLVSKLRSTLNEHLVKLAGGKELLCCQVGGDPVRIYGFAAASEDGV